MAFDSPAPINSSELLERFKQVRSNSDRLSEKFTPEDWMIQSMREASPIKWNLAHTSWFFETFILKRFLEGYQIFHRDFEYLFNSYYNQIGSMHPRPDRGLLSRPSASEVSYYRCHIDESMCFLLEKADEKLVSELSPLVALGIAHEEQHQELLITDIQHAFSLNPVAPVIFDPQGLSGENDPSALPEATRWVPFDGGLVSIGTNGTQFAFDNEGPSHQVFLAAFALSSGPVTNGEFLEFIRDGGYQNAALWLSDGWDCVRQHNWTSPAYWRERDGEFTAFSLFGERPHDPNAPVCHVSFYEAAAYAHWAGARLASEAEWEHAASTVHVSGNFMVNGEIRQPTGSSASASGDLVGMFGDVWEWTSSPYVGYPGYQPDPGAIGEYNGKFMSGQMVLRGGSCATPSGHIRPTYRNFFPPATRWQFSGFRLARS